MNQIEKALHKGISKPILTLLFSSAVMASCGDAPLAHDNAIGDQQQAVGTFSIIGNIFQSGMLVTFEDMVAPAGLDLTKTIGLTACSPQQLYAVQQDQPPGAFPSLFFSKDAGASWTKLTNAAMGAEIACDHAALFSMDTTRTIFRASLLASGELASGWTRLVTTPAVDHIQGGDGTIFGVKIGANGSNSLYAAAPRSVSESSLTWGNPLATIGAIMVTGTGTTITGTDMRTVTSSIAWPWSAYALEANGIVETNHVILSGSNLWSTLDTGSERYKVLTAAASDVLFALQVRNGAMHLNRITMKETDCFDKTANGQEVDNDHDGLANAEDPDCKQIVADHHCQQSPDGTYCGDRFQPKTMFLGQPNQNTSLVRCSGGAAVSITMGACVDGPAPGGADKLRTTASLNIPEPSGSGHWCNVIWPDGSWGFNFSGSTPCNTLKSSKPNGTIVRAGIHTTTGFNDVLVRCSDGAAVFGGTGTSALQAVQTGVGHGTNRCYVTVGPRALPVWNEPFNLSDQISGRVSKPFMHNKGDVDLSQFGNNEMGFGGPIDRLGHTAAVNERAYDYPLDEGVPVYAVADGVVLDPGSRDRDVNATNGGCGGTAYQGEIYVQHKVGSDSVYQETYVAYYAHVRRRLVESKQTVKMGQILGYVGATGCAGGFAHLHMGAFRLSNVNAHKASPINFGYHMNFVPDTSGNGENTAGTLSIDPLGWAAPMGFDPIGHAYRDDAVDGVTFTGDGAWSSALFRSGKAPRFP
jgi:murein DD-endopeptidase MepM/ murein hydrolase activator NlpD